MVRGNGFIIDDLTQHGIDFIEKNKNQPFFLYLHTILLTAYASPDRFWKKYKDKKLSQIGSEGPPKNQNQIDHTRAALAMCENIDWNVGRIIEHLKNSDLLEKTIVIYLSDNGPNGNRWNGNMKGRKGSTDEGGVRSPMIINWSGKIPKGKIINQIASGIDLLPTLKDLTGIKSQPKKPIDGISLQPLIMKKTPHGKTEIFTTIGGSEAKSKKSKLPLGLPRSTFDMINDPSQTTDISIDRPQVVKEMLEAKEKWEKTVLVELPNKDKRPFYIGHSSVKTTKSLHQRWISTWRA